MNRRDFVKKTIMTLGFLSTGNVLAGEPRGEKGSPGQKRQGPKLNEVVSIDELTNLFKERRSIRHFRPGPLPEGAIEQIIETARWAPSGADSQPWEFVVVERADLQEKMEELYRKAAGPTFLREQKNDPELRFPMPPPAKLGFNNAAALILMLGDPRTKLFYPLRVQEEHGDEVFISSLSIAFFSMHLAARSLGLGSCWISAMAEDSIQKDLKTLLGIPPGLVVYEMMAVGHPAYHPGHRSPRKLSKMVHRDGFQKEKFRTDQQIREGVKANRKGMPH